MFKFIAFIDMKGSRDNFTHYSSLQEKRSAFLEANTPIGLEWGLKVISKLLFPGLEEEGTWKVREETVSLTLGSRT